jgi:hypothetical protein
MSRPRRLYINSKGKYYYIVNGKKKFVKVPEGMSQKQVQTINIKNIIGGPARRMKKRTGRRIQPKYDKKLVKGEDMQKTAIKTEGGLPTYVFTPQRKFLSLGDIATKTDDTSDKKLIDLLKGILPKTGLPKPSTAEIETQTEKTKTAEIETQTEKDKKKGSKFSVKALKKLLKKYRLSTLSYPAFAGKYTGRKFITIEVFEEALNQLKSEREEEVKDYEEAGKPVPEEKGIDIEDIEEISDVESMAGVSESKEGFGDESGDDGLYNDQIETIMKKRIKNFVPVVASDQVNSLLNHVQKGDKFFASVVNTEPSESSGRHWRCIVIDNRDDFTSAEYFDPLAEKSQPEQPLLDVMRKIAKRMNPEKYFKYKFNKLQRQNFNKSNCGYHCMKFIEDRFNGVPFSESTGWDSYMKRQKGGAPDDSQDGEGDLKSYQKMIEKKFSSYL